MWANRVILQRYAANKSQIFARAGIAPAEIPRLQRLNKAAVKAAAAGGRRLGFDAELFDLAIKRGETQPHELGSVHFVAAGLV